MIFDGNYCVVTVKVWPQALPEQQHGGGHDKLYIINGVVVVVAKTLGLPL